MIVLTISILNVWIKLAVHYEPYWTQIFLIAPNSSGIKSSLNWLVLTVDMDGECSNRVQARAYGNEHNYSNHSHSRYEGIEIA